MINGHDALNLIDTFRGDGNWLGDKAKNEQFSEWIRCVRKELNHEFIVKDKKVNFVYFLKAKNCEDYNRHFKRTNRQLKQEEFDLLYQIYIIYPKEISRRWKEEDDD